MELILWRHAEAEDGMPDMERRLTSRGEKQANKMAAFLRPLLPGDIRILSSPAMRTRQTAQALSNDFVTESAIAPGASTHSLLKTSGWQEGEGNVLIVGHQPVLGQVAALLMTGVAENWSVKKGAIWWFSRHKREGDFTIQLRLVIAPDQL